MDWKTELGEASRNLDAFREAHPSVAKGFSSLHHGGMKDGALGVKEKELIALAIGIARQCVDCIGFHTKAAIAAGATREEISETIGVSVVMGGGPAFMYGVKALEAFEQFSD